MTAYDVNTQTTQAFDGLMLIVIQFAPSIYTVVCSFMQDYSLIIHSSENIMKSPGMWFLMYDYYVTLAYELIDLNREIKTEFTTRLIT
jgi:hypothetical protein